MSTEPQRTCPSCGSELSGAMEFCPVCMLRKALAGGAESGESSASEDTVKPTTPEQTVQRFEHYELVTGEDGKPVALGRGAIEFVTGETLENLLKRSGRLDVKLALEIATQVAAGLVAVHKQKLVHRDIKPSNVMVSLEDGGPARTLAGGTTQRYPAAARRST
jgi:hypothetical protein